MDLARLVVRQEAAEEEPAPGNCITSNDYDGRMGLRISAVFVILVGSMLGKPGSSLLWDCPLTLCRRRVPRLREATSRDGHT